jgi:hypothetical protein
MPLVDIKKICNLLKQNSTTVTKLPLNKMEIDNHDLDLIVDSLEGNTNLYFLDLCDNNLNDDCKDSLIKLIVTTKSLTE